jgi:hypothetical protein
MLQGLFRKLVCGQVVSLPVVHGSNPVRVRGKFMEFGCSLMRVTWHGAPLLEVISHISGKQHIFAAREPTGPPSLARSPSA